MIVSVSRRCDIPSYFGKWFINRLDDGYVLVVNPYNNKQYSKISLAKEHVDIFIFWTKNPIPFMKYLPIIDKLGYPYYFEYTITPYGKDLEINLPDKDILLDAFITLSKKLGKNRVVWRYDPIIINDKYTIEYHHRMFEYMAKKLNGYCNRCIISFVDNYKNVQRNMGENPASRFCEKEMYALTSLIAPIARQYDIVLVTCSEKIDLDILGVQHGACIDKYHIESILEIAVETIKDNQRQECRCLQCVDIGTYNSCNHGCVYCYANNNMDVVKQNIMIHDPNANTLIGKVSDDDTVIERKMKSIIKCQLSLF